MCQAKPNGLSLNSRTITHTNSPDKPEEARGKHDQAPPEPRAAHSVVHPGTALSLILLPPVSNGHRQPRLEE